MKRFLLIGLFALTAALAYAMDYEEARQRAWFLTDKMAYELNLTPEQYDRAYEVNLDYLMSIRTASDCSGIYWQYRDADLRCILFDWQYTLYRTIDYFFRPIRWLRTRWYFPIFERYRQGYYFFSRPTIYISYHGRPWHSRRRGAPSPYRKMHFRPGNGMRDRYEHSGRPGLPRPGVRPGQRPGQRPPGLPGEQRPGQRPGNQRPEQRPENQRPGNQRPNQRPGNQRPGNQRPSQRPGNQRPSQRPRQEQAGQRSNQRTWQRSSQGNQRSQVRQHRPSRNSQRQSNRSQRSSQRASRPAATPL